MSQPDSLGHEDAQVEEHITPAEPVQRAVRDDRGTEAAEAADESRVVAREQDSGEQEEAGDHGETVQDPAKLVRLGRMITELLGEVREAELDEETLDRLRTHVERTATEVGDSISPDLREELTRLRTLWVESSGVSQAELRVEQAQLAGWLEGVLQGIQGALSAEQAGAQEGQPGQATGRQG